MNINAALLTVKVRANKWRNAAAHAFGTQHLCMPRAFTFCRLEVCTPPSMRKKQDNTTTMTVKHWVVCNRCDHKRN